MLPYRPNRLGRCGYPQNDWSPSFAPAFLDSMFHTAALVFFYNVHLILLLPSLNLPQGHSFTHRVSSEIQTLTYKALCDLVPKLPLQPFSYFSALFSLCSNHLGFLNVLWTCRTYTFFRTFVIAVQFAWDNFPSDNYRACWDTAFGFLPNRQRHPT